MESTRHRAIINGIPVTIPNMVIQGNGFYVSYNSHDTTIYGCDTTALVTEIPNLHFYILNGDHREAYQELIPKGISNCIDYFKEHIEHTSKYSEKLPL